MPELLVLAERYGAWVVIIFYTAYKLIPVAAEKVIPDWLSTRRSTVKADRESLLNVYERFIAQNAEMIRFIASSTEATHSFGATINANTLQVAALTRTVERGPSCPLPDCPYWDQRKEQEVAQT